MSTKDEKDWLRAILEGKVKPGDAEWERIWKEEDFTGVRRVLKEVGMRKKDELVVDREKMWRVVKQYRVWVRISPDNHLIIRTFCFYRAY